LTYEIIKLTNTKKIIQDNFMICKKIFAIFTVDTISDDKKEELIFKYSGQLLTTSIKLIGIIFLIIILIFIFNYLNSSFLILITSIFIFIEITILMLIYHLIRKKINAKL
jgi:hypothetical protein